MPGCRCQRRATWRTDKLLGDPRGGKALGKSRCGVRGSPSADATDVSACSSNSNGGRAVDILVIVSWHKQRKLTDKPNAR
jgi:hypothetical protein